MVVEIIKPITNRHGTKIPKGKIMQVSKWKGDELIKKKKAKELNKIQEEAFFESINKELNEIEE